MTPRADVGQLWEEGWWTSVGARAAHLWRGVEAQHIASTMKLVDSLEEQAELERILEASKPSAPAQLHFLWATPFRYPSPHGSRFRSGGSLGIWYGAETTETACTELAYWRWRFLLDSDGLRSGELIVEFTLFAATVAGRSLDLSEAPWDQRRNEWTSDSYAACLRLAGEARRHDVQWIRYWSARHVAGHCAAVLAPEAFSSGPELKTQQTWHCKVTAESAFMRHDDETISLAFQR